MNSVYSSHKIHTELFSFNWIQRNALQLPASKFTSFVYCEFFFIHCFWHLFFSLSVNWTYFDDLVFYTGAWRTRFHIVINWIVSNFRFFKEKNWKWVVALENRSKCIVYTLFFFLLACKLSARSTFNCSSFFFWSLQRFFFLHWVLQFCIVSCNKSVTFDQMYFIQMSCIISFFITISTGKFLFPSLSLYDM